LKCRLRVALPGNMKKYVLGFLSLISFVAIVSWVSTKKVNRDIDKYTSIRMLGHRIMLNAGDLTGRVLPIETSGENEYLIRFENDWTLNTDSLASISKEIFPDLIKIKVYECDSNTEVYSFSINGNETIIPCLGRKYDKGCYYIKAKLINEQVTMSKAIFYLPVSLLFLGCFTFLFLSRPKLNSESNNLDISNPIISRVKEYSFDHSTLKLNFKNQEIPLSSKEADIASLFFKSPNTLIQREYLMKTVWEDQGVIVGRSLDVFISRLRKKLTHDPYVKLVSVFGKGYKLEVSDES
jgi:hypothetical protein